MANTELDLIVATLRRESVHEVLSRGVKDSWFFQLDEVWKFITDYCKKYNNVPSLGIVKEKFSDVDFDSVSEDVYLADWDYLIDELRQDVVKEGIRYLFHAIEPYYEDVEDHDWFEVYKKLRSNMDKLSTSVNLLKDMDIIREWGSRYKEFLNKSNEDKGIVTQHRFLDMETNGFHPGNVIVMVARPGQGKSWICTDWAVRALFQGFDILHISLEMTSNEVGYRVDTIFSNLVSHGEQIMRNRALNFGDGVSAIEYKRYLEGAGKWVDNKYIVATNEGSDRAHDIESVIAKIDRYRPGFVVVDYITLLTGTRDQADIAEVTKALKKAAIQYNTVILEVAQVGRSAMYRTDKNIGLEDIAYADAIGQDPDKVVTLQRDRENDTAKVCFIKNRQGRDEFDGLINFKPDIGDFSEHRMLDDDDIPWDSFEGEDDNRFAHLEEDE